MSNMSEQVRLLKYANHIAKQLSQAEICINKQSALMHKKFRDSKNLDITEMFSISQEADRKTRKIKCMFSSIEK